MRNVQIDYIFHNAHLHELVEFQLSDRSQNKVNSDDVSNSDPITRPGHWVTVILGQRFHWYSENGPDAFSPY